MPEIRPACSLPGKVLGVELLLSSFLIVDPSGARRDGVRVGGGIRRRYGVATVGSEAAHALLRTHLTHATVTSLCMH